MDYEGLNVARALEETIQREAAEAEEASPPDTPPDSWVRKNIKSYPRAEKLQLPPSCSRSDVSRRRVVSPSLVPEFLGRSSAAHGAGLRFGRRAVDPR